MENNPYMEDTNPYLEPYEDERPSPQESPYIQVRKPEKAFTPTQSFTKGMEEGASLGFSNEMKAYGRGIGANIKSQPAGYNYAYGMIPYPKIFDRSTPEYKEASQRRYNELQDDLYAAQQNPKSFLGGEVTGAIAQGFAASPLSSMSGLSRFAQKHPILSGMLYGGATGQLYGMGTSEGTIQERADSGLISGLGGAGFGGAIGLAGRHMVGPLTRRFLAKKAKRQKISPKVENVSPDDQLTDLVQATERPLPAASSSTDEIAIDKVSKAIQQDYPQNYEQIMDVWKKTDKPLAEIAGSNTTRLARGAAQFSKGEAKTRQFFDEAIPAAKQKIKSSIADNIGDYDSYYTTAQKVVEEGRNKASPFYKKAYEQVIEDFEITPDIQKAIDKARAVFPEAELGGYPDNSIKVLDYAKRYLDDIVGNAEREGKKNLSRSYTGVVKDLRSRLIDASEDYGKALKESGDYLSVSQAMEEGRNFSALKNKRNADALAQQFKSYSPAEQKAYKLGVAKKINEEIDNVIDTGNPYNRVFGKEGNREVLAKILDPQEYKSLERQMQATKKLFDLRKETIGGSPTVPKAMAAAEISPDKITSKVLKGRDGIREIVQEKYDAISDDVADQITELLYAKSPKKQLKIISKVTKNKNLTPDEKQFIKRAFFETTDEISFALKSASGSTQGNQVPEVTIRAEDYQDTLGTAE